jgi:integrase/recombinase XerD
MKTQKRHVKNQTGDKAMETPVMITGQEGRLARQAENDSQLISLWIHGKSDNTAEAYRRDVERFMTFTGKGLPQVTLADVQAFADSLEANLADASRARMLAAVKSLLTFGHKVGYLLFNVGAAIELPKVKNTLAERFLDQRSTRLMIDREPPLAEACHGNTHDY